MKNKKTLNIITGVIILLVGSYFLYFREYFDFKESISTSNPHSINKYIQDYPNGRYIDQAKEKLESVSYSNVVRDSSYNSISDYMSLCPNGKHIEEVSFIQVCKYLSIAILRKFKLNFPNSRFKSKILEKEEKLWQYELKSFEDNVRNLGINPTSRNVTLFRNLLNQMKSSNEYKITIKFDQKIDLKDYMDYSIDNRLYGTENYDYSNYGKPNFSNVYPVKSNFDKEGIESLEIGVFEKVKGEFEQIFTKDFFEFDLIKSNENKNLSHGSANIQLSYTIENQMLDNIAPNLWVYTESNNYSSTFKGYVLGLDTQFGFEFVIPQTQEKFTFKTKGSPGDHISNFDDIGSAYRTMIANTFDDFINQVTIKLGLGSGED